MARSTITFIDDRLAEKSTGVATCAFKDENGQAVTPTSATWTLSDTSGTVINSREDVVISSLDTSVDIVLSGDDLAISAGFAGDAEERVLTVEAVYDSDLGSDLPAKAECHFYIENLAAIT